MTSPINQLARSAASLGVLQIGGMVLTLAVGVLLARQLGPAGYGVYALAMATVTLAGMATEFGLPLLAMKEFGSAEARDSWGEARGLIRWADRIILGISALIIGGFLAAAAIWDFAGRSAFLATMVWAALLIPVVAIAKLRGLALLSLGHTFAGQFAVLVLRPGLFALSLAVIWVADEKLGPAEAMAWQVAAAAAALITVLGLFLRYRPIKYRTATPINRWKSWLPTTIPMGMTEGLRLLQGQIALMLLGILVSSEAAGVFRVAEACAAVGIISTTILNVAAAPHFARLHATNDMAELQRLSGFVALGIFASVGAATLILAIFAPVLLGAAFGDEFASSAEPLLVLMAGQTLVGFFGPVITLSNMAGLERKVMVGTTIAVVCQILVAIVLIPTFGPTGAAVAVVLGMLAGRLFLTFEVHRKLGLNATVTGFDLRALATLRMRR